MIFMILTPFSRSAHTPENHTTFTFFFYAAVVRPPMEVTPPPPPGGGGYTLKSWLGCFLRVILADVIRPPMIENPSPFPITIQNLGEINNIILYCKIIMVHNTGWPEKKRNSRYSRFSGLCSNQQLSFSPCWREHLFLNILTPRSSNLVKNSLFYK